MSAKRRRRTPSHADQLRTAIGAPPDAPWLDLVAHAKRMATSIMDAREVTGCEGCPVHTSPEYDEPACNIGDPGDCPLLTAPLVLYRRTT